MKNKSGFTLIELSIVLVIIGLIIGGVLVGQDLIRAAEIRSTVAQKEKFDAAALAFKLKYGGLPGDIVPSKAAQFGLFQLNDNCGSTCATYAFGNGRLDYSSDGVAYITSEYLTFWRHLSEANLIEGRLGQDPTYPVNPASGNVAAGVGTNYHRLYMPVAKLKAGKYWVANVPMRYRETSLDYYYTNKAMNYELTALISDIYITPALAYALDSKIDDGKPNTGIMVDFAGAEGMWSPTPADGVCTYSGVNELSYSTLYNVDPATGGNTNACYVAISSAF